MILIITCTYTNIYILYSDASLISIYLYIYLLIIIDTPLAGPEPYGGGDIYYICIVFIY